jgi:hypothetical protein
MWLDNDMTHNYPPRIGERISVDTELGQEDGVIRSVATTGGYATIEFADRVRMTIRYMGNGRWVAY